MSYWPDSDPRIPANGRTVQVGTSYFAVGKDWDGPAWDATRVSVWYRDRLAGSLCIEEIFEKNVLETVFLIPVPLYGVRLKLAMHRAEKAAGKFALEVGAGVLPPDEGIVDWPTQADLDDAALVEEAMAIEDPWAGPIPPLYSERPASQSFSEWHRGVYEVSPQDA